MNTTKHPEFTAYSVGLVNASVCTRLPLEAAQARLNQEHPTGIDSQWELSEDKEFKSGETNPCQCEDDERNKHYLFSC